MSRPVMVLTKPARAKAEAIMTMPMRLCQILAKAASTFLASPLALMKS